MPMDEDYQIYDKAQFERYLSVIESEQDRFMATPFFYYGLRCGELLGLKWSDFDGGKLSIRRSVSQRGFDSDGPEFVTPKTRNSVREYPIINAVNRSSTRCPGKALVVSLQRQGTAKTYSPRWATAKYAASPSSIRRRRVCRTSRSTASATPASPFCSRKA
ncbi:MAG: hypothetical protein IJS37_03060 [Bacilli bacterium]|nr:hypothetical protein [Bacilli bacterium]